MAIIKKQKNYRKKKLDSEEEPIESTETKDDIRYVILYYFFMDELIPINVV